MWMIFPLVFLAGFVDSIAGGGGLISLPAYMAVGLPAHMALGTNKFSSVVGTGISTVRFVRNGFIQWDAAIYSFIGALLGSTAGSRIAVYVDERILTYFILAAVPFIALFLILKKDFGASDKSLPPARMAVYAALVGLVVGAYDGFFGPGTGTFLILAFTAQLGLEMLTACGNAKAVNLASNIAAALTFILSGNVNFRIGIPCALCGVLGNYIGSGLAIKNGTKLVRPMMLAVIALLLIKILWDLLK